MTPAATFYTIADSRFFLGLVGLLNSLRLTGHDGELVVLDCGLTPHQKDLLKPHCTLFEMPRDLVTNPQQFKPFPYLLKPQGTIVIIDSDIIVTRSLANLIVLGSEGKICVFPDPEYSRWFAEWQRIFALPSEPRRQTYVNSGFVCFSTQHWPRLLEHWWKACERIFSHPTYCEGSPKSNPTAHSDQDAFNSLLMTEVPLDAIALQRTQDEVFLFHLEHVRVTDEKCLACSLDGEQPILLHSYAGPKPWEPCAWPVLKRTNAYIRLLRRLLTGDDVTLRIPDRELPPWLHSGAMAEICLWGLDRLRHIRSLPQQFASRRAEQRRVAQAKREITALVPEGHSFILVDEEQWEIGPLLNGRRRIPFLERDGQYWGNPEDDETAIREFERLRQTGADHIVFAWQSFWWLDRYGGLRDYLQAEFQCVVKNNDVVIFNLSRPVDAAARVGAKTLQEGA